MMNYIFRFSQTFILSLLFLALGTNSQSKNLKTYPPVKKQVVINKLHAPSYPLITIDPYTSAWSFSDHLYDESVKHWTGKDFPLLGVIKVDGICYRFMGTEGMELIPIVPTSEQGVWSAKYTMKEPLEGWQKIDFDDSAWQTGKAAFGIKRLYSIVNTEWKQKVWVRRTFNLPRDLRGENVYMEYTQHDKANFYINGIKAFETPNSQKKQMFVKLTDKVVASLKKGNNVISADCSDINDQGRLDFGLLIEKPIKKHFNRTAQQTSVEVQPMQTNYAFICGPVNLKLIFTAPLFLDNLNLVSRPVNYISYFVSSNDNKSHKVEIYFEASPQWALDSPYQQSAAEKVTKGNLTFLRTGSRTQHVLQKQGDDVRIDWGYLYLASNKNNTQSAFGNSNMLRVGFLQSKLQASTTPNYDRLAIMRILGNTSAASGHILIGYDDLYSIKYLGNNLRPYWNRNGNETIYSQFEKAEKEYQPLMQRCANFDQEQMQEAIRVGGKEYSELCALAYRQSIAAQKLVQDKRGELLYFSKENYSNGSIGTVDVTYPSAPLLLLYNPELAKAQLNYIFYYSESGKWNKPFAAHDVGTYPIANGQTYGGNMPVEENGNMLLLTAAICKVEGNPDYARKHWKTLTTWTEYLMKYGLDPENQLCTDDFAGHFAHNANLSIKAILGIAAYGQMANMLGHANIGKDYTAKAREMASKWMQMADDGDHYRLTFDKPGTWSQKYNLVWDKLLNMQIFPQEVFKKEVTYYLKKQNTYGLPLDNRKTYTKTDWITWTATLSPDKVTFEKIIAPLYKGINEATYHLPMSDWVFTEEPAHVAFRARSVVGGYYIKMLEDKINSVYSKEKK